MYERNCDPRSKRNVILEAIITPNVHQVSGHVTARGLANALPAVILKGIPIESGESGLGHG